MQRAVLMALTIAPIFVSLKTPQNRAKGQDSAISTPDQHEAQASLPNENSSIGLRTQSLTPFLRKLMRLASRVSSCPPSYGNRVTIQRDEETSLQVLKHAIESARSYVHLEYYMFKSDEAGRMIRDAIIAKARQGVRCRVLLDYFGSLFTGRSFTEPMTEAGVEVNFFLPVWRWQWPGRVNHRKMLVVDGQFGFVGSHNIGDEYRGRHPTLGSWQDTNVSFIGPAVQQLQGVFARDWLHTTGIRLIGDKYFPRTQPAGDQTVQLIPSGPDSDPDTYHDVILSAISSARRSIHILTAYFVPEKSFVQALKAAARRGVKVQLLIPSRTDRGFVLWAGRSFYPGLCRAGVEIYEYDRGMLHNKIMVVDDGWSMVGSANLNNRSVRLDFELSTVLYDEGLARELLEEFNSFLNESRRVTPRTPSIWNLGESLTLDAAWLISPFL